jgi:hypothetical protein
LRAVRWAQWRLKQRLETIDFQLHELEPEVERMVMAAAEQAELPEFVVVDERDDGRKNQVRKVAASR